MITVSNGSFKGSVSNETADVMYKRDSTFCKTYMNDIYRLLTNQYTCTDLEDLEKKIRIYFVYTKIFITSYSPTCYMFKHVVTEQFKNLFYNDVGFEFLGFDYSPLMTKHFFPRPGYTVDEDGQRIRYEIGGDTYGFSEYTTFKYKTLTDTTIEVYGSFMLSYKINGKLQRLCVSYTNMPDVVPVFTWVSEIRYNAYVSELIRVKNSDPSLNFIDYEVGVTEHA